MSSSACARLQALSLGGAPGWNFAGAAVSFKTKVPPFSTHSCAVSIRGVGLPPAHVPLCCKFKRCAIPSGVACNRPRPATPEYVICTGKQQQPAELAAISGSQRLGWCARRSAPPPHAGHTTQAARSVRFSNGLSEGQGGEHHTAQSTGVHSLSGEGRRGWAAAGQKSEENIAERPPGALSTSTRRGGPACLWRTPHRLRATKRKSGGGQQLCGHAFCDPRQ